METESHPGKSTVLAVDDNIPSINYLSFILRKLDIMSLSARSGQEALDLLKDKTVDCMLIDIRLGAGISGLTLMERLREEEKFATTPMIAVSALSDKSMRDDLLQRGFNDVLEKPFTLEKMKTVLGRYVPLRAGGVL